MAVLVKHAFVSLKGDGTDATQVQPSNWNAAHSFTLNTGALAGRLSAGAGPVEEIPLTNYMANLLQSADQAALANLLGVFDTGDVKWSFKSAPLSGWICVTVPWSIGNASSGATTASAGTFALWQLLYANCSDALAPVGGGRSGNAVNDFNANKFMTIPQLVGRSPIGAGGAGSGTSARVLGTKYGEENHLLTIAEIPAHTHANTLNDPGHTHTSNADRSTGSTSDVTAGSVLGTGSTVTINSSLTGVTISNAAIGGGGSHNVLHPVIALYAHLKL